jgi:hypothetical protein
MKPTTEQIKRALPHVRYEIESLLLIPEHDRAYEALAESVMFRRMAHCRGLFTFFSTPSDKRFGDDVISEDFNFPSAQLYGINPKPLLEQFNKRLFHITYSRIGETTPWPTETLLPPVIKRSREFIEHILNSPLLSDAKERNHWEELKANDAGSRPLLQYSSNSVSMTTRIV